MKKLLITAIAAITIGSTFAMTAEEAIASKNYNVIAGYCATNNIKGVPQWIARSNEVSFADFKTIYETVPTKWATTITYPFAGVGIYQFSDLTTMTYDINKIEEFGINKFVNDHIRVAQNIVCHTNPNEYQTLVIKAFDDIVRNSKYESIVVKSAIAMDTGKGGNEYKTIAYNNVTNNSLKLDLAIAFNDVDKIIDNLLLVKDYTSTQVSEIIEPINAVDADYRKADILKALNNVNSKCTIKLYDDQTTWEPLIAKIRAMISVRK